MSKRKRNTGAGGGTSKRTDGRRRSTERRISVRAVRRNPPDVTKLGRAIIRMAVIEAEAERAAQASHRSRSSANSADVLPITIEVDHEQ